LQRAIEMTTRDRSNHLRSPATRETAVDYFVSRRCCRHLGRLLKRDAVILIRISPCSDVALAAQPPSGRRTRCSGARIEVAWDHLAQATS
jgi:hypothetical protein